MLQDIQTTSSAVYLSSCILLYWAPIQYALHVNLQAGSPQLTTGMFTSALLPRETLSEYKAAVVVYLDIAALVFS